VTAPLVSVCVPAHDQAPYIAAALRSALAQDVDLEVVVQDDASTDGTGSVVDGIADPRVRYARHGRRLGVAATRNACLARARGRYVAWLDADDEHLPGMLARQVEALEADPGIGLAHGGFQVMTAGGEPLADWPAPFEGDAVEAPAVAFRHLLASNEMTTSTVVVRRECHDATGGFRPEIGVSSTDWDAWLRIVRHNGVAYTAAPVARYRQHKGTISSATTPGGQRLRCDIAVVRHVLRHHAAGLPDGARMSAAAHAALATKALDHAGDLFTRGHRSGAARAVAHASRLAPSAVSPLAPRLLRSTMRGDEDASYRTTRAILGRLADRLEGTRYGRKVRRAAAGDPEWEAALERIARGLRRTLPRDANVAAVAKWDPTLLSLIEREGRNFPDRGLMPDGYPRDGAAAVEHLEQLRREGVSHLVVPSAYSWWLDHYTQLADHLEDRYRREAGSAECLVFDLRGDDARPLLTAAR